MNVKHKNRDPHQNLAILQAIRLFITGIKFKHVESTLHTRNIRFPTKDC